MNRKRVMRGGNATTHSSEYYGNDSGSYSINPPAVGGSAYGPINPVSFGHINPETQTTGPNTHVYPNGGALIQTGGNGCGGSAHPKVEQFESHGCGYKPNQGGGNGCGGSTHPKVEQFESHGCGYKPNQGGGNGCGGSAHPNVEQFESHGCGYKQVAGCNECECSGTMQAHNKKPSKKKPSKKKPSKKKPLKQGGGNNHIGRRGRRVRGRRSSGRKSKGRSRGRSRGRGKGSSKKHHVGR